MSDPTDPGAARPRAASEGGVRRSTAERNSRDEQPGEALLPSSCPRWVEVATNAAIVPEPSGGNDPELSFAWAPLDLRPNRSCCCDIVGPAGHALTARIEQALYNRTIQGTGRISIAAVPVAPVGTKGRLTVSDESSGRTAEYSWEWKPIKQAKWIGPLDVAKPSIAAPNRTGGVQQTWNPKTLSKQAFFGIPLVDGSAAGTAIPGRFAFVLDMSGSMLLNNRWETCLEQLSQTLNQLPRMANVCVILYSSILAVSPDQNEWALAEPRWHDTVRDWISQIRPGGGTRARPAFEKLYSLQTPPDVIFLLTDGIFEDLDAEILKNLIRGKRLDSDGFFQRAIRSIFGSARDGDGPLPTIHTVTLDDASGAEICREIAKSFGGRYVHAATRS